MKSAISLFAGAGGMDVGFQSAGYRVVWANELDKHAAATYRANLDGDVLRVGDINGFLGDLPPPGEVNCVFGGPPCQGFSVAGKMDIADPRSALVFAYLSVVEAAKPKAFVLENVKALASLSKFSTVRTEMLRRAEAAGYDAKIYVLNARNFGVPQSRERMFMIGVLKELRINFDERFLAPYLKQAPTLRELFSSIGRPGTDANPSTCGAKITLAERPVLRKSPYAGMIFNGLGRPLNPEAVSCTLPASMGGNKTPIVDDVHMYEGGPSWVEEYHEHLMSGGAPFGMYDAPASLRRLTITEARAIQTFPINYRFEGPKGSVYCQIGNAVPCGLAYAVASAVSDALDNRVKETTGANVQFALV
jgi:DNA (cytosine-5)-methyltransferase 1